MAAGTSAIRRLTLAGFISATWTEAAWVALAFNLYRETGSGLWVAAVFLLALGIPGFLTPIGGAIADRFDRRRVMVIADALAAAAFVVLVFTQRPVVMLTIAFVAALVERPFGPAPYAAVPNLVDDDRVAKANGTLAMGWELGVVVGATLGGVLFDRYGPGLVFGLNAASFLASSGLILTIRASFSAQSEASSADYEDHRGVSAGFRFVARRRQLLSLLIAWFFIWLAVDVVLIAEPAFVRELRAGALGYGLLATGWGVGRIGGAFAGRRVRPGFEVPAVLVETIGTSIGLAWISFAPSIAVAVAGMAFVGAFDAFGEVAGYTLLQRETPDRVRGRVVAAFTTAGQTGNTIGFLAGGSLLGPVGARGLYRLGAAASAVAGVVLIPAARTSGGRRRRLPADARTASDRTI